MALISGGQFHDAPRVVDHSRDLSCIRRKAKMIRCITCEDEALHKAWRYFKRTPFSIQELERGGVVDHQTDQGSIWHCE